MCAICLLHSLPLNMISLSYKTHPNSLWEYITFNESFKSSVSALQRPPSRAKVDSTGWLTRIGLFALWFAVPAVEGRVAHLPQSSSPGEPPMSLESIRCHAWWVGHCSLRVASSQRLIRPHQPNASRTTCGARGRPRCRTQQLSDEGRRMDDGVCLGLARGG